MQRFLPTRVMKMLVPCAAFALGGAVQAQVNLSAKPSAAIPATSTTQAVIAPTPSTPAQRAPKRAEVTFSQGQLAVSADNASLNQILREISRQTGIKITGGVADERVFGHYGPLPASQVLATLLDGTSSNVLLLQADSTTPGELILTPRQGGPTPPNPNAPGFDDDVAGESDQPPTPQAPVPTGQQGAVQPQNPQGVGSSLTPPASATDPSDPNAVKTPQQIYEQLQRLRAQQQTAPQ